jgi:hypothetical protein
MRGMLDNMVQQSKHGRASVYTLGVNYLEKFALYNVGASVPLDVYADADMVSRGNGRLTVYRKARVGEIELGEGQEIRRIWVPQFDELI